MQMAKSSNRYLTYKREIHWDTIPYLSHWQKCKSFGNTFCWCREMAFSYIAHGNTKLNNLHGGEFDVINEIYLWICTLALFLENYLKYTDKNMKRQYYNNIKILKTTYMSLVSGVGKNDSTSIHCMSRLIAKY